MERWHVPGQVQPLNILFVLLPFDVNCQEISLLIEYGNGNCQSIDYYDTSKIYE